MRVMVGIPNYEVHDEGAAYSISVDIVEAVNKALRENGVVISEAALMFYPTDDAQNYHAFTFEGING